ncbi:hypothetical protein MIMGU_mgv1a0093942mg, partial [Erythranthe guttata]
GGGGGGGVAILGNVYIISQLWHSKITISQLLYSFRYIFFLNFCTSL